MITNHERFPEIESILRKYQGLYELPEHGKILNFLFILVSLNRLNEQSIYE